MRIVFCPVGTATWGTSPITWSEANSAAPAASFGQSATTGVHFSPLSMKSVGTDGRIACVAGAVTAVFRVALGPGKTSLSGGATPSAYSDRRSPPRVISRTDCGSVGPYEKRDMLDWRSTENQAHVRLSGDLSLASIRT